MHLFLRGMSQDVFENEIPKDNFVDSDLAVYPQIRKFLLDNFK